MNYNSINIASWSRTNLAVIMFEVYGRKFIE